MSRFSEEVIVTKLKEAVAPRIEITWNVLTNEAKIYFYVQQAVYEDGSFVGFEDDKTLDMSRLIVNFADIANDVIMVPLPDGTSQPVPAMLLMGAIKAKFDSLYSAHRVAYDNPANPEG